MMKNRLFFFLFMLIIIMQRFFQTNIFDVYQLLKAVLPDSVLMQIVQLQGTSTLVSKVTGRLSIQ